MEAKPKRLLRRVNYHELADVKPPIRKRGTSSEAVTGSRPDDKLRIPLASTWRRQEQGPSQGSVCRLWRTLSM